MYLLTRLRNVVRRNALDRELDDEFATHLAFIEDEARAAGRSPADARRQARARFGNPLAFRERTVDVLLWQWLETLRQDMRYGVRQLLATPLVSIILVATLALAIGLTVAMFSVVDAVLLRPLPFPHDDQLVMVWETLRDLNNGSVSLGAFNDWTRDNRVFSETAAINGLTYNLSDTDRPERLSGARVTPSYFRIADLPPATGRYFTDDDAERDARLVVLSHTWWQQRFGGNPSIVGQQIRLSGESYTVVGVAPASFALTDGRRQVVGAFMAQVWTPFVLTPAQRASYGTHAYRVIARLKPGVSRELAQQDLLRITRDIARRQPTNMEARSVHVQSYREALLGTTRAQTVFMLIAVSAVLLIGCVNISSLLLARATVRRQEMAIRAALGGGRSRIVRQLLTESVVLALAGGLVGLAVAQVTIRFLVTMGPPEVPRLHQAGLHVDVLLFTLAVTLGTALLFGLAPAIRVARSDLQSSLREGGRSAKTTNGRDRVRSALVVAEVALSVMLIVAAGLFIRSAWRLEQVPLGFAPEHVLMARVSLPASRYESSAATVETYRQMMDRVRAIPGATHTGASTDVPMNLAGIDASVAIEGRTQSVGSMPISQIHFATDGYVETIGMPLKRGRTLQPTDMAPNAPPVVVVNERFAQNVWPGESPLGKRVACWTFPAMDWREVVGVVGDARSFGPAAPIQPELFIPYTQAPEGSWAAFQRSLAFVVRTSGAPAAATDSLRQAIWDVDRTLPLYAVQTFDQVVATAVDSRRFSMLLMSLLAGTGLALAAVGMYGIVSYSVAQRRSEIGVRLALGATGRAVMMLMLRYGVGLAVAGIAVGIALSLVVTRFIATLLFEVTPTDGVTYAMGTAVFLAVALIASTAPAWSATRVNPARTLADG